MPSRPALILVVDDDEPTRDATAERLKDAGFEVRGASNGRDALELLATLRPDLIILDWKMPVMSGEELLAALRADASLASIPAVILTALRPWEITVMDATILHKPVQMKELLKVVSARLR